VRGHTLVWHNQLPAWLTAGAFSGDELAAILEQHIAQLFASMLELIGDGSVIAIDIDIRPHNRALIEAHPLAKRIVLIEGSSTDARRGPNAPGNAPATTSAPINTYLWVIESQY